MGPIQDIIENENHLVLRAAHERLKADAEAMRSALANLANYLRFCEARTGTVCYKAEYADHAQEAEAALAGSEKYNEWVGECESEMQQFLKDSRQT